MNLSQFYKEDILITWAFAFVISVSLYLVLLIIQKILVKKGSARAVLTTTLVDDLLVEVLLKIKKIFILALSIYLGLIWVKISSRTRLLIDKTFILILLIQFGQIAGLVINFWFNKHLKVKSDQDLDTTSTVGLITIAVKCVVYAVIFLLALNNLGVDITALIAGMGIGGVAVALALQNILADLFSSLTIVLDKPFIVGDFIAVNDFMGTIEHIGLKTTRLRSLSGEQLIFGNGDLLQSRIKNYKRMTERRVAQALTVTYQTLPDVLEKIPSMIQEILKSIETVRFERCHFLSFQDSSLGFELVYWVKSPDFNFYADCAQTINLAIHRKFNDENIEFAYPTQTLFVEKSTVKEKK